MFEWFKQIWNNIKHAAQTMWNGLKQFFSKIKNFFTKKKEDEHMANSAKKAAATPKQKKSKNSNKKASQLHKEWVAQDKAAATA